MENMSGKFEHDVAISYAGEDRKIAEQLAKALKERGLSVFYDRFSKDELWGKQLSTWFKKKYGKSSLFVLVLISQHYPVKDWTNFEFATAKAEEKKRKREFILPVRLDKKTLLQGLPTDKGYLDFNEDGIDGIAECLVQKIKKTTSGKGPEEVFADAYQEWKKANFLPGETKVRYFLDNIGSIPSDVDSYEFFIRSLVGYHPDLKEKLGTLDKGLIFKASIRMLNRDETFYTRWRGIRYAVFADPRQAESYLWDIFNDQTEDSEMKTAAFEKLWKCESKRGLNASYAIVLMKEHAWQLRKAALKNIGHGEVRDETARILTQALKDKRGEVRSEAAYSIVRLQLNQLAPDLMNALKVERSRKCANRLLYCLVNFNTDPKVQKFANEHNFPKWFYSTPDYHEIWSDLMDEWL